MQEAVQAPTEASGGPEQPYALPGQQPQTTLHTSAEPREVVAGGQPLNGSVASLLCLPSVGSAKHGTGECKPCAWFWKPQGCRNGKECAHCHACPSDELKSRKKRKQATRKKQAASTEKEEDASDDSDADDPPRQRGMQHLPSPLSSRRCVEAPLRAWQPPCVYPPGVAACCGNPAPASSYGLWPLAAYPLPLPPVAGHHGCQYPHQYPPQYQYPQYQHPQYHHPLPQYQLYPQPPPSSYPPFSQTCSNYPQPPPLPQHAYATAAAYPPAAAYPHSALPPPQPHAHWHYAPPAPQPAIYGCQPCYGHSSSAAPHPAASAAAWGATDRGPTKGKRRRLSSSESTCDDSDQNNSTCTWGGGGEGGGGRVSKKRR